MSTYTSQLDSCYPAAATVALALIGRPEVANHWEQQSLLPKMSVGALACHLGRQTVLAADLLATDADLPRLLSAEEHYHNAAWVTSQGPDDPVNDRSTDDAAAALGPTALVERVSEALASVRRLLVGSSPRQTVPIPWQGWSLSRDQFLLTRLMETIVHADDLALSVGVSTPEFPGEALTPVLNLLVRLAVHRHGHSSVISSLARSERAQAISAF